MDIKKNNIQKHFRHSLCFRMFELWKDYYIAGINHKKLNYEGSTSLYVGEKLVGDFLQN